MAPARQEAAPREEARVLEVAAQSEARHALGVHHVAQGLIRQSGAFAEKAFVKSTKSGFSNVTLTF